MTAGGFGPLITAETLDALAELAVLRALEAAGKRARLPRPCMAEARRLPSHTVHTRFTLAGSPADMDRLLDGVWAHLRMVLPADIAEPTVNACDGYVRELISTQCHHQQTLLQHWLADRCGG